ncbi:MAG: SBBP repeat-containing protein [candidate division Zixibacteria bacterium]|nr:SBBP repeat-containing protein [candidate division Zixibacteria bacterium]
MSVALALWPTYATTHALNLSVSSQLTFEANRGQFAKEVLFRTRSGSATVWFCRDGIYYQFTHHVSRDVTDPIDLRRLRQRGHVSTGADLSSVAGSSAKEDSIEMVVVKAVFVQASPRVEITGEGELAFRCNYFLGNDPSRWHTDVPNYSEIVYRDIFPGVDAHFTAAAGQLQTKWVAKPGADLSQVQFQYMGNAAVTVVAGGGLRVEAPWGTVLQSGPAPQDDAQVDEPSLGTPAREEASSVATTLVYSTFLGGSGDDESYGVAVDAAGSAYATGYTASSEFPTQNPFDGSYNGDYHGDAFVTKLSASGNAPVYSTFLGGSGGDAGTSIVVDAAGTAYVTGDTYSSDFPTQSAYDGSVNGDRDVFVTELSAAGNALVYSTFLGGSGADYGNGIALDASGSTYVTGETRSSDFPTLGQYNGSLDGVVDAFVTKLSAAGNALVYSTYLGGSDNDGGYGIAVDASGSAYVTGVTLSSDFPTQDPYDGSLDGVYDAFVAELSAAGNALVYSTFLGGSDLDLGSSIAVDASGSAYVTGETRSYDFPTQNPYDATHNGGVYDAFVTKLSAAGNALVYSTFLGGSADDRGFGIAVDTAGSAYVTGFTYSSDFPTQNPYDGSFNGASDAFVTQLSAAGNVLVYSTFLGGINYEGYAGGIAVDTSGSAYVTGYTASPDFPTQNPYDSGFNGYLDAFIAKLGLCGCPCHADPKCDGQTDILDVVGVINVAFRGQVEQVDPNCPKSREDVDCGGFVDIVDVVHMVNVAFRGNDAATEFCHPCL